MTSLRSRIGGWAAFAGGVLAGWFFLQTEHRDVRYATFTCYSCGVSPRVEPSAVYLREYRSQGWIATTLCPHCQAHLTGHPDRPAVAALVKLGATATPCP